MHHFKIGKPIQIIPPTRRQRIITQLKCWREWWADEWPRVVFLCALVIGVVTGVVFTIRTNHENDIRQAKFYTQCLQDHKQYECDVLWNQARR